MNEFYNKFYDIRGHYVPGIPASNTYTRTELRKLISTDIPTSFWNHVVTNGRLLNNIPTNEMFAIASEYRDHLYSQKPPLSLEERQQRYHINKLNRSHHKIKYRTMYENLEPLKWSPFVAAAINSPGFPSSYISEVINLVENPSILEMDLLQLNQGYRLGYDYMKDVMSAEKPLIAFISSKVNALQLGDTVSGYNVVIRFKTTWSCESEENDTWDDIIVEHWATSPKTLISRSMSMAELTKRIRYILYGIVVNNGEMEMNGSGYFYDFMSQCCVDFLPYSTVVGSYISLPKSLIRNRSLLNIHNEDNQCFFYCILALKHYDDAIIDKNHRGRAIQYNQFMDELKSPLIDSKEPMPLDNDEIARFEKENLLRVNVYSLVMESNGKKHSLLPIIISKKPESFGSLYNLLAIGPNGDILRDNDGDIDYNKFHYVAITNFNRFVLQDDKHDFFDMFVCPKCVIFHSKDMEQIELHKSLDCREFSKSVQVCPNPDDEKNAYVKFRGLSKILPIPVILTCDFESILVPINECMKIETEYIKDLQSGIPTQPVQEKKKSVKTFQTRKHKASHVAVCCKVLPQYKQVCEKFGIKDEIRDWNAVEQGEDFIRELFTYLTSTYDKFMKLMNSNEEMNLTAAEEARFQATNECWICKHTITSEKDKVRDHDHLTGKFRGAACYQCNIQVNARRMDLPVFLHNLKNYDLHLLVHLATEYKVDIIANTLEKYMTMRVHPNYVDEKTNSTKMYRNGIRFLDSYQHIVMSLETMVDQLVGRNTEIQKQMNNEQLGKQDRELADKANKRELFPSTLAEFGANSWLFYRKGAIPYSWLDSVEKLKMTELPPIECWTDTLTGEKCKPEEYQRYLDVWRALKCKTILDYQRAYVRSDVSLLADVFDYYRKAIYSQFELDPAHYLTSPSLAWDLMLKTAWHSNKNFRIENITDINMYLLYRHNIRGGISMVCVPMTKANHKYLEKIGKWDPNEPSVYILYLDANALYASSMLPPMPIGGHHWINEDFAKITNFNDYIMKHSDNRDYLVDLKLPESLHDYFKYYPPHVEQMTVKYSDLSPLQREMTEAEGIKPKMMERAPYKLVPTVRDWNNCLHNATNLKWYIKHGGIVSKIHRGIEFNVDKYLSLYILKLQTLRIQAEKDGLEFMRSLWKLMGNAVYGKTIEGVEKRADVRLLTDARKIRKLTSSYNCKECRSLSDEKPLFGIEMIKPRVVMNKPIFIGFEVLENSKTHMFSLYYDTLKKKYNEPEQLKLLITDTDSLIVSIQTDDVYKDIREDKAFAEHLDLSGFAKKMPDGSPGCFDASRKGVYGLPKGEVDCTGLDKSFNCIVEAIGLRAKMYSLLDYHDHEKSTAKGIGRSSRKSFIGHSQYSLAIDGRQNRFIPMATFKSEKHQIYSQICKKKGLSALNDKRYYIDKLTTLPYGHYLIPR